MIDRLLLCAKRGCIYAICLVFCYTAISIATVKVLYYTDLPDLPLDFVPASLEQFLGLYGMFTIGADVNVRQRVETFDGHNYVEVDVRQYFPRRFALRNMMMQGGLAWNGASSLEQSQRMYLNLCRRLRADLPSREITGLRVVREMWQRSMHGYWVHFEKKRIATVFRVSCG